MRSVEIILAAAIGAVVAIVATQLVMAKVAPAPSVLATPLPNAPNPSLETARRVDALEAQIRTLAVQQNPPSESPPPKDSAPPPDDHGDRQAALERFANAFDQRLATHAGERRDPGWASEEEASIGQTLQRIGREDSRQSFTLVDVDCRSSTCASLLQWPNEQMARAELSLLLNSTGEVAGCARQIYFPTSGQEPYRASLLFDCAPSP